VLGNHDYKGNYRAQIDFTSAKQNPSGFWYLPDRNYIFQEQFGSLGVDFFVIDTNGCQASVVKRHPNLSQELVDNLEWLKEKLAQSNADMKIVIGHHPVYTKGRHHGIIARCLREETWIEAEGGDPEPGYGMERVLLDGGTHIYLAGHEHVLQHKQQNGINYFVVSSGGSGFGFNGGEDVNMDMNWFARTPGFMVITITDEGSEAQFIDLKCNLLYRFHINHTNLK